MALDLDRDRRGRERLARLDPKAQSARWGLRRHQHRGQRGSRCQYHSRSPYPPLVAGVTVAATSLECPAIASKQQGPATVPVEETATRVHLGRRGRLWVANYQASAWSRWTARQLAAESRECAWMDWATRRANPATTDVPRRMQVERPATAVRSPEAAPATIRPPVLVQEQAHSTVPARYHGSPNPEAGHQKAAPRQDRCPTRRKD